MENKKQNYNKETLYKVYLEMKKDAYEGLKYMKTLKDEEWYGDDENCSFFQSIAEGTTIAKYHFIIPDKNIHDFIEFDMLDKKTGKWVQF